MIATESIGRFSLPGSGRRPGRGDTFVGLTTDGAIAYNGITQTIRRTIFRKHVMAELFWRIEMLGGFAARSEGGVEAHFQTRRAAALLARLAFRAPHPEPRESLAASLWPDEDWEATRNRLRQTLVVLRRALSTGPESGWLVVDRNAARLLLQNVTVDVLEFDAALRAASNAGSIAESIPAFEKAIDLYRGPLLSGFHESWIGPERARLNAEYLTALTSLAEAHSAAGNRTRALGLARLALAQEPLREETHCTLMRLYAAAGQTSEVQRQYEELERLLQEQFKSHPSAGARALLYRLTAPANLSAPDTQDSPAGDTPEERPWSLLSTPESIPPSPGGDAPQQDLPFAPRLPLFLTSLLGREREGDRLAALLMPGGASSGTRLVTLTGPGGVGKTRLAAAVATQLVPAYEGAVWFVPLSDLSRGAAVPEAVARSLGLPPAGTGDPIEPIRACLAGRPALLVLDNFEQLLRAGTRQAAVGSVRNMLERVPDLNCLLTSRQRLGIAGERCFPVPPLEMPELPGVPERLQEFGAVQLFVERAQAVAPDFILSAANASVVTEICRKLEGIPLAIELAAAWSGVLDPEELLERLSDRFRILKSREPETPNRHSSLRAAIAWSYELLEPQLQRFFAKLSVFRGGWTVEAAEQICEEPSALEFTARLRDCSLVMAAANEAPIRLYLLETLREFAAKCLESEEAERLRRSHAAFFLSLAEQLRDYLDTPEQESWLDRLEREEDNFRAALEWLAGKSSPPQRLAVKSPGSAAQGPPPYREAWDLRMAGALFTYWYMRGLLPEARRYLLPALRRAPADIAPRVRATALNGAAVLEEISGNVRAATNYYETFIELAESLKDDRMLSIGLANLATLRRNTGDYTGSIALYSRSLEICRVRDDVAGVAYALDGLGAISFLQGDYAGAWRYYTESLQLKRASRVERPVAAALHNLAGIARVLGRLDDAHVLYTESLKLNEKMRNTPWLALDKAELGALASMRGDHGLAHALLEESLELSLKAQDMRGVAETRIRLGYAGLRRGDLHGAEAEFEESLALCRKIDNREGCVQALQGQGDLARDRALCQKAGALYQEALELAREIRSFPAICTVLNALGELAAREEHWEEAVQWWGYAESSRRSYGIEVLTAAEDYRISLPRARAHLGEAAFAASLRAGEAAFAKALGAGEAPRSPGNRLAAAGT